MLKDVYTVTANFGANAGIADTAIWTCPEGAEYEVVEVNERHEAAGTDGGAVAMDVVKAASGTAVAGATTLLASTFDMKATAATNVRKSVTNGGLVTSPTTRKVTGGQVLGLDFTGTLTALVGLSVTITLKLLRAATRR